MLGLTLGFGGGNGFVLMGQALTFLVFFLMMKYVIGRIKMLNNKIKKLKKIKPRGSTLTTVNWHSEDIIVTK